MVGLYETSSWVLVYFQGLGKFSETLPKNWDLGLFVLQKQLFLSTSNAPHVLEGLLKVRWEALPRCKMQIPKEVGVFQAPFLNGWSFWFFEVYLVVDG